MKILLAPLLLAVSFPALADERLNVTKYDRALAAYIDQACLASSTNITQKFEDVYNANKRKKMRVTLDDIQKAVADPRTADLLQTLRTTEYSDKWCKDWLVDVEALSAEWDTISKKSNNSHADCLDAKDYEGCVRVKSGKAKASEKLCNDQGYCQANGEIDGHGHLMPKGWWCKSTGTYKMCVDESNIKRVPHKGQASRYIAMEALIYEFKNATAGTAARSTTIGSAQTNCYGYGSSISCTTTPPATMTIPGTPGTTAGWVRFKVFHVNDCKDKTAAMYWKGKPNGNWIKANSSKIMAKFCPIADTLPERNMKL